MIHALAYKSVLQSKEKPPKKATEENPERARDAIEEVSGMKEKDETIWMCCRSKNLRLETRQFTYKIISNSFRVGISWLGTGQYESRAICPSPCGHAYETMDRILTKCKANHVTHIWKLAKMIWPHNETHKWPGTEISLIMGCGAVKLMRTDPPQEGKKGDPD
jgi:hypothetical protein